MMTRPSRAFISTSFFLFRSNSDGYRIFKKKENEESGEKVIKAIFTGVKRQYVISQQSRQPRKKPDSLLLSRERKFELFFLTLASLPF